MIHFLSQRFLQAPKSFLLMERGKREAWFIESLKQLLMFQSWNSHMHSGNLDREIALNWKHWSSPNSECVFASLPLWPSRLPCFFCWYLLWFYHDTPALSVVKTCVRKMGTLCLLIWVKHHPHRQTAGILKGQPLQVSHQCCQWSKVQQHSA